MKKFFSDNWRRIILVLCAIAIVINVGIIFLTPSSIVKEYAEYGPTVHPSSIGRISYSGDIEGKANDVVDDLTDRMATETGTSDETARIVVIGAILVCGVLILSTLIDSASSSSDAKKK